MNQTEIVLEALRKFTRPVTAPVVQSETNPTLSYANVVNSLNELSRKGMVKEGANEVGKRTYTAKGE